MPSFARFTFRPYQAKYIDIHHISDIHVWKNADQTDSSSTLMHSLVLKEWKSGQQVLKQDGSANEDDRNYRNGRIASFSWWRDLKRFQGYANLAWWRDVNKRYPTSVLSAALEDMIQDGRMDRNESREDKDNDSKKEDVSHPHLLLTGDITNIALEREFAQARSLLQKSYIDRAISSISGTYAEVAAGMGPCVASVLTAIPGNHDTYVPSALSNNWFGKYFGDTLRNEDDSVEDKTRRPSFHEQFPAVKLLVPEGNVESCLGSVTLICLNSGLPTKPFIARGFLSNPVDQLAQASSILKREKLSPPSPDLPGPEKSFKIVLIHHPPVVRHDEGYDERSHGLDDTDKAQLAQFCEDHKIDLVVNGHSHIPSIVTIPNISQRTLVIDPGSGTQVNTNKPHHMARYNVYKIDLEKSRMASAMSRVYQPSDGTFSTKVLDIDLN